MSSQHIVDKNIKGGYVTLRFNNTGSSWLHEANGVGETVNSMKLSNVLWSANQSGTWTIQRGEGASQDRRRYGQARRPV